MTLLLLLAGAGTISASARLEASLEMDRVYKGNPVYLYLKFTGSTDVRPPEVDTVEGLNIRQVGSSTQMSAVGGKVSRSITYSYLVLPREGGTYTIGPFYAFLDGQTYRADPVTLRVDEAPDTLPASPRAPSAPPGAPLRPDTGYYAGTDVFLRMEVPQRTVYVNEVLPVTITLYVDNVGLRGIEYPVFPHEGFSTGEVVQPERKRASYRGRVYDTLQFRQELSAFREGDYTIGPATLKSEKVSRAPRPTRRSSIFGVSVFMDDPFSTGTQTTPIELRSNELAVTVLPFPREDRPEDFKGAVGIFSFEASVAPRDVAVGDPITVTMRIRGEGNLDMVTAPELKAGDDFRVYEPEVSKKGNLKTYEQILIPRTETLTEVPEISFSFLNPSTGRYETRREGPFPIRVAEAPEASYPVQMVAMPLGEHIFQPEEEIGRDILHIKYSIGRLVPDEHVVLRKPYFWALQLLAPLAFFVFYFSHRKRTKIRTDRRYARSLKAPRKARSDLARARSFLARGDYPGFYDAIQKTLQEYLGNKFDLSPGRVMSHEISEILSLRGADRDIISKLEGIFSRCEMARYASSATGDGGHRKVYEDTRKVIDHVEKLNARSGPARGSAGKGNMKALFIVIAAALSVILMGPGFSDAEENVKRYFEEGNRAYEEGDYYAAAEKFEKALSSGKTSASLFYNLAGAYLKSGEIGRAVLNYKRALAISPRDPDIRSNYRFARSMVAGRVPPRSGFLSWRPVKLYARFFTLNELTAITSFSFFLVFVFLALAATVGGARKKMIMLAALTAIFVFLSSIVVFSKLREKDSYAVTVVPAADALFGPFDTATKFFTLHEGGGVIITEEKRGWYRVRRSDGMEGWVKVSQVERI